MYQKSSPGAESGRSECDEVKAVFHITKFRRTNLENLRGSRDEQKHKHRIL